ncbi:universal stress protein [Streptantibioticus ferralitis]|uniref:Universal stress protein n=1 Tax=Streptantibioticus ferralitis TaxID=236510 RepID=A0ABT5Z0W5_9ACTN|nr:universal stress protein [Streptantibioticus ferralitis]MDF2257486.1 universal stress protein [Streptantibioticus ferralitis]
MNTPSADIVVVGFDRSQAASRALAWAADEAARRETELHILHALGVYLPETTHQGVPDKDLLEAEEDLEQAARRAQEGRDGLVVTWEAVWDEPVAALIRMTRQVALAVVGARGLNRFSAVLLGSVSQRVAAHSAGPVVVVRGTQDKANVAVPGAVVLGAAPGESPDAVEFAFAEAARWHAPLHVVRAWMYPQVLPGYLAVPLSDAEEYVAKERAELADMLASGRYAFPDVDVTEEIRPTEPEEALINASHTARLVVVGARRHRPPFSMPLGKVVQRVLHHADCPVAVVPT